MAGTFNSKKRRSPSSESPDTSTLAATAPKSATHRSTRQMRQFTSAGAAALAIAAVAVTSTSLRPGATCVGTVLAEIQTELGVDSSQLGLLTALPGFTFALFGFLSNKLTPKMGMIGALLLAMVTTTAGLLLRAIAGTWWIFVLFTVVALAGMAIGNVILPAFIKSSFPKSTTAVSTIYITFLAIGATLPTALGIPMLHFGSNYMPQESAWRFPVGFWFVVSSIAAILWWILLKFKVTRKQKMATIKPVNSLKLFRSPTALAIAFFFGSQAMQAYIQFGWAAQMYRDGGLPPSQAGMMVSIIVIGGIPAALIMPRVVAHGKGLKLAIMLIGLFLITGYMGIAFLPTTFPWVWALCLSLAGFAFPASLAMIISRTRNPNVTSAVSGFAQPIGYIIAGSGPLAIGWAFKEIGNWPIILLALASTSIVVVVSGLIAASDRYVDDEIGYVDTPV